jgi:hypothetical protein
MPKKEQEQDKKGTEESSSSAKFCALLEKHIFAGSGGLRTDTYEIERTVNDIDSVVKKIGGSTWRWDIAAGILSVGSEFDTTDASLMIDRAARDKIKEIQQSSIDRKIPTAQIPSKLLLIQDALRANHVAKCRLNGQPTPDEWERPYIALVLENFDVLLKDPITAQTLLNEIRTGQQESRVFYLLGPKQDIPVIFDKVIDTIPRPLPDTHGLLSVAKDIVAAAGDPDATLFNKVFPEQEQTRIFQSAAGLTEQDAASVFSLCMVESDIVQPRRVFTLKTEIVKYSSALQIHSLEHASGFESLGDLSSLKKFLHRSVIAPPNPEIPSQGVLLVGVPGTGKSAIAKALGVEAGLPVIQFVISNLLGKYVGDSEKNTHKALESIEQMSPCILWIDEIEKALAGGNGGNSGDNGVMTRTVGTLLTWLQDNKSGAFVVGTCNDIASLRPELTRAGRFDGIFFLDLPSRVQRDEIWKIHLNRYKLDASLERPNDHGWTGAEIETCCKKSAQWLCPLIEAAGSVAPIYKTSAEQIKALRAYADNRFLDANKYGLYNRASADLDMNLESAGAAIAAGASAAAPKVRVVRRDSSKDTVS